MFGKYTTNCVEETISLATKIAKIVNAGEVLALIGDLGTGKTAFTQGFAKAMGISDSVGSPTFKLVSEYEGKENWLYHIDCYRLDDSQQFINIGGEDYLANKKGITIIEWADIIEDILPRNTITINIARIVGKTDLREISITKKS